MGTCYNRLENCLDEQADALLFVHAITMATTKIMLIQEYSAAKHMPGCLPNFGVT